MKTTQVLTLAVLCGALSLTPSAMAQSGNSGSNSGAMSSGNRSSNRTEQTRDTTPERNEGPNLGWLGLLGLAGLAGLLKKPQREVVRQTEVRTVPTPGGTPNVHK